MKFFSKEKVNTERQIEFDIAKCICIIGMILVHCFEELGDAGPGSDDPAYFITVVVLDCLFGASVFMSSMGLGIAYSWKENADRVLKRGFKIFLFGYLLSFVRETLPYLVFGFIQHNETFIETSYQYLFYIDIMEFAGLALMLFGMLKKLRLSDQSLLAVALGMSVIGSFVRDFDLGSFALNQSIGLFFGTNNAGFEETCSAFPLFNWFIFVIAGYLYAEFVMHIRDKKRYYLVVFPAALVVVVTYLAIAIPNGFGMMSGNLDHFYHMTTLDALICFAGMLLVTSGYYFLSKLLSPSVKHILTRISSNINRIYCIHWIIIGWMTVVIEANEWRWLTDKEVFITAVLICVIACVLAECFARWKARWKAGRNV